MLRNANATVKRNLPAETVAQKTRAQMAAHAEFSQFHTNAPATQTRATSHGWPDKPVKENFHAL